MKNFVAAIFVLLYVLFVSVSLIYYPPVDSFALFALIVVPAVALWVIFWGHLKAGQGFLGLIKRKNKEKH